MKPDLLQDKLGLSSLRDRTWYIQPCSAIKGNLFFINNQKKLKKINLKGDGLYEGLVWLSTACK